MVLNPDAGHGRKNINDTHCWAKSIAGERAPYKYDTSEYERGTGRVWSTSEITNRDQVGQESSNGEQYAVGQQSSEAAWAGGGLLVAYATFLGIIVALQELLNLAPDGKLIFSSTCNEQELASDPLLS